MEKVELVGGPQCGAIIDCEPGQDIIMHRHAYGIAEYRYEGYGKAIYVRG